MSTFIQQTLEPSDAQPSLQSPWLGLQPTGTIDPLLDRAMALTKVGVWSCDLSDDKLSWSSGVFDLFGLPIDTTLDRQQIVRMYTEDSREALETVRTQTIAQGGIFRLDTSIVRPNGEMRWMRISGELIHPAGGPLKLHGLKQDVTEEKLRFDALRRLAENDPLTGLANRAAYESYFLNTQRTASSVVPLGALILFDLDSFKEINDRFGHLAGDACLQVFAERLSGSFPKALLAARIGGDEFAVIVTNEESPDVIEVRIARFLVRLRAPILWRGHMLTVGVSSGLAVPTDPYSYDPEELFIRADAALYANKKKCR